MWPAPASLPRAPFIGGAGAQGDHHPGAISIRVWLSVLPREMRTPTALLPARGIVSRRRSESRYGSRDRPLYGDHSPDNRACQSLYSACIVRSRCMLGRSSCPLMGFRGYHRSVARRAAPLDENALPASPDRGGHLSITLISRSRRGRKWGSSAAGSTETMSLDPVTVMASRSP